MHSDSYQTYIKSLNATPTYYPFGKMRELVMNHNARRRSAFIPFFRYAVGLGLLATLIGGIFFINNSPNNSDTHSAATVSSSAMASIMNVSPNTMVVLPVPKEIDNNSIAKKESKEYTPTNNENLNVNQNNTNNKATTYENPTVEHTAEQTNAEVPQTASALNTAPSVSSSLNQISNASEEMSRRDWSGFVSGGPIISSNSFSLNSIFGAAGVHYRIAGSSSLVAELRHTSFAVNRAGQNGGLHDTTFIIGGHSYTNTIGTPSQSPTTSNSFVNSVDLGYRYVLEPNVALSPSAEILAGASTFGFVSVEAIGIEYQITSLLTLDLSARAEQLFSSQSVPLTTLGFEAGIGFGW